MSIFKYKALNSWSLFLLISGPISASMVYLLLNSSLDSGEAISRMIQLSVRCAIPFLFIAFAASSIQTLFPGVFGRWLLKNRKMFGLCFAAAMAWQLLFILWLVTVYQDYYIGEVYVLRDAIEGVIGYLFLIAMTVTSFKFGRQQLTAKNWLRLHKIGIYFLWAYAFSTYWWSVSFYEGPNWIDYSFYTAGFVAWALRAAAWRKKKIPESIGIIQKLVGYSVLATGLFGVVSGLMWQPLADQYLWGYALTEPLELYLPYWPFDPYLPLFVIAAGVYCLTVSKAR